MAEDETEREMVQRHVREGEAHVVRQREIVAELQERGDLSDRAVSFLGMAIHLLEAFEDTLDQHNVHLARLEV